LGRGDPQAAAELRGDAEPVEHRADLRAAAVHHDRFEARRAQVEHGPRERGRVGHGVPAVLDHHGHGATPSPDRPAVSARPSMRLAHCTAWPAAPLPGLSGAAVTTTRPESGSVCAARWQALDPRVAAVRGSPAVSTCTKGSCWYACVSAPAASDAAAPAATRTVTVARMPRGIG